MVLVSSVKACAMFLRVHLVFKRCSRGIFPPNDTAYRLMSSLFCFSRLVSVHCSAHAGSFLTWTDDGCFLSRASSLHIASATSMLQDITAGPQPPMSWAGGALVPFCRHKHALVRLAQPTAAEDHFLSFSSSGSVGASWFDKTRVFPVPHVFLLSVANVPVRSCWKNWWFWHMSLRTFVGPIATCSVAVVARVRRCPPSVLHSPFEVCAFPFGGKEGWVFKDLLEPLTVFASFGATSWHHIWLSSFLERWRCVLYHPGRWSTDESSRACWKTAHNQGSWTSRADL